MKAAILACLLAAMASPATADTPPRLRLNAGLDVGYVAAGGHPSWTSGASGKLRFDDSNDGLLAGRAFADMRLRLADTLDAHIVAEAYDDDLGGALDLTRAWLEWRPLTLDGNRYRVRAGAFYPQLSLENSGPAWSSPYSISSSAINTWIAEELRLFGAELAVSRRPQRFGGAHTVSLRAALYWNNDPAGALLAWKGWSLHDRQTRFNDELPLAPLPQIQPGGFFDRQDPLVAPFREIDDRPGFYVAGEWQYSRRLRLRAAHYDNGADPVSLADGQYGWGTRFDHAGLQAALPADVGLIAQWMRGTTVMGPWMRGAHVVDTTFASSFLLLTRAFDNHRLTLRYDRFEVDESDDVPLDDNGESGHALTAAWLYDWSGNVSFAVEWLEVTSRRPAWGYFGLATERDERQLQLVLRLGFETR